jgi:hypothetical protein
MIIELKIPNLAEQWENPEYVDINQSYFKIENDIFEYFIDAETILINDDLGIEQKEYLFENIFFKKESISDIRIENINESDYCISINLKSGKELRIRYNDSIEAKSNFVTIKEWWLNK